MQTGPREPKKQRIHRDWCKAGRALIVKFMPMTAGGKMVIKKVQQAEEYFRYIPYTEAGGCAPQNRGGGRGRAA